MAHACVLSCFSHVRLFATPRAVSSSPGSSVHGIPQARILDWVAIPFSRGSSQPRDWTLISLCLLHWQAGSLPLTRCSRWGSICQYRGHGFDPWSKKIPHAAEQLSQCAITTEPTCCSYWSPCISSLCSEIREANALKSLCAAIKSNPWWVQLEKTWANEANGDIAQPKKKKNMDKD